MGFLVRSPRLSMPLQLGVLLGLLVVLAPTAAAEPEPLTWQHCLDAVPWAHHVHVPNMETRLLALASTAKLAAWSEAWIADAVKAAPSIDSLLAKAGKEKKLLFWYVPSIAGQQVILPHFLDRYMSIGPLSDPGLVSILRKRCVCLKLPAGGALAKRFGLGAPDTIEPACLLLDSSGEEIWRTDRITQFDTHWLRRELERVLPVDLQYRLQPTKLEDPSLSGSPQIERVMRIFSGLVGLQHDVDVALRAGDVSWAVSRAGVLNDVAPQWQQQAPRASVLQKFLRIRPPGMKEDPWNFGLAFYVGARAYRRGSQPALAEQALGWAAVARDTPEHVLAAIPVERGRAQLEQGKLDAARTSLTHARQRYPTGRRAAEAAYWLGVVEWYAGSEDAARAAWTQAMKTPDLPAAAARDEVEGVLVAASKIWRARAAACLAKGTDRRPGESPITRAMVSPESIPTGMPSEEDSTIRLRALRFLLGQQRSDGHFEGPRWGGAKKEDPPKAPKPFNPNMEVAITALAAAAISATAGLLPERAKAARARAETWLLDDPGVRRGDEVIWVYADGFRLLHFAGRLPELKGKAKKHVKAKMQTWINHLVLHQAETGGSFKHYVYESTFVTASILHCLHTAKKAGLKVPAEVFERAAKTIESARDPESGLFGYRLKYPHVTRTPVGAAQRGPLCTYALLLAGRTPRKRVRRAVDLYFAQFESTALKARHSNFHIPALGNCAGYYFWHDFYYASLAAHATKHKPTKKKLLAHWRALPGPDGSFVDASFSYGKAYGTAMGLLSYDALQGD